MADAEGLSLIRRLEFNDFFIAVHVRARTFALTRSALCSPPVSPMVHGRFHQMGPITNSPEVKNIEFTNATDLRQKGEILSMMRALYAEDEAASPIDQSRF